MAWACYSSSSTCIAFVATLLRLLLFAVLSHLVLCWHKTTPGWFYRPEGGGFNKGGGFIPPKGWLYPPKGVVLSPEKGGFIPLKSGHKTTRGGFIPHLGVFLCPGPGANASSSGCLRQRLHQSIVPSTTLCPLYETDFALKIGRFIAHIIS